MWRKTGSVGEGKDGMEDKDSNNDTAKDVNNVTEGFNSSEKNYATDHKLTNGNGEVETKLSF